MCYHCSGYLALPILDTKLATSSARAVPSAVGQQRFLALTFHLRTHHSSCKAVLALPRTHVPMLALQEQTL